MDNEFEVTWEADDGYAGGSRPHSFTISEDEFADDDDDKSLSTLFWDLLQTDFEQTVSPFSDDEAAFIAWAKAKIAERASTENV